MDSARAAVSKFTSGGNKHDTTVDETVARPTTSEHIKPTRVDETQTAIDREVHQDHYHTTVQPVTDRQVMPEQHSHNMAPVQEKSFTHGDDEATRRKLAAEAGQFKDTSTTHSTQHTQAAAPTVEGEHVHHHVHETVQPIIQKETIAPEVVHTTVPVHEMHHAKSEHHGMSALPTKTLEEFTAGGGGANTMKEGVATTAHETYEGKPRPYNEKLQTTAEKIMHPHGGHSGTSGPTGDRV